MDPYEDNFAEAGLNAWPAFVDLLAATSLLLLALLTVVVVWTRSGTDDVEGRIELQKEALANALRSASLNAEDDSVFTVDAEADLLFVRVTLPEDATFPTNEWRWDSLQAEGREALRRIGERLREPGLDTIFREVRVVGHSDQRAYDPASNFTNWELSAARAAVVTRFLVTVVGVDPCKISTTGYGPYRPVHPPRIGVRETSTTLAPNRRIELEFVPMAQAPTGTSAQVARDVCYPAGDSTARGIQSPGAPPAPAGGLGGAP